VNKVVLNVNYIVDGILTVIPTTMFYEEVYKDINDEEIPNVNFEINLGQGNIKSKLCYNIENAIINLQKSLPSNIKLACCQSCRYGNFCPFGNKDNEIFCFSDTVIKSKLHLCDYFSKENKFCDDRKKKLLEFCTEFKPVSVDEYYSYNDWDLV